MDKQSRRDAIRDYKERKVTHGVFAVRCAASGEAWVGATPNVEQMQNRIWFGLRQGGHPNPAMRAAWAAHGEGAFAFEVLEEVDTEDLGPLGRESLLKDRTAHWREALGAKKVVG
jgi:hypothetical protein